MTKNELKQLIVPRIAAKRLEGLRQQTPQAQWVKVHSALQGASAREKAALVNFALSQNISGVGKVVLKVVKDALIADAIAEVDAMLVDDSMTLDEIERAFK